MAVVTLQKGNLFNPLTGYFDFNLLNSSEYDLEIDIDGEKEYYRVRFRDFKYVVTKLKTGNNYEFIKPTNLRKSQKDEILEFRESEFYRHQFENRTIVEKYAFVDTTSKYQSKASYSNFFASIFQKNNFNSIPIYSFYVDSKNWNNRKEVLGYKVSIENVKNHYYIVFLECIGKDLYHKDTKDVLWFIYERKEFLEEKSFFEDKCLSLSENDDYPLLLAESFILLTGGDKEISKQILKQLEKYRDYFRNSKVQKFLRREFEKRDGDSIRNSLIKILGLNNYQSVKFGLENNTCFSSQLVDYIMSDDKDVESCVASEKTLKKELTI